MHLAEVSVLWLEINSGGDVRVYDTTGATGRERDGRSQSRWRAELLGMALMWVSVYTGCR